MKLRDKVALTTFSLFMIEAIMHYNLGKDDCPCKEGKQEEKKLLPPTRSLVHLALIVGVFSVINGVVVDSIKK